MKPYALLLLLISSAAAAQSNYNFANAISWQRSVIALEVPDSISVRTLTMLGRLDIEPVPELSGVLPSEYNWTREVRLAESYKRMALRYQQVDGNGMELMRDFNREVTVKVLNRDVRFDF